MSKVWSPRPLELTVVEVLEKKGALNDVELLKELKANFGEVSFREMNATLMKMELGGVVWVTRLMRGKRQVELTKKG